MLTNPASAVAASLLISQDENPHETAKRLFEKQNFQTPIVRTMEGNRRMRGIVFGRMEPLLTCSPSLLLLWLPLHACVCVCSG
jgi:hypothetical protein